MSLSFQNDESPADFWAPLFLAYRDITGQAPIDKVAYPGVHVTPACFANDIYDGKAFQHCFSSLLSAQFRRFIIDLYWDVSNRHFALCPAELPHPAANATQQPDEPSTNPVSSVVVSSPISTESAFGRRQDNSTSTQEQSNSTTNGSATTTLSSAITTTTSDSGSDLLQLGPYQCSDDLVLDSLLKILNGYVKSTGSSTDARFLILQFNLHAAAPPDNADGLPRTPSAGEMPKGRELVGSQFDDDLGGYIYRPSELDEDRKNLNATWFQVTMESRLPVTGYYDIFHTADGILATPNGWPSETYLLFSQYKRFLLSFGEIDASMMGYDFERDKKWFFPSNQTAHLQEASFSADRPATSGCFYTDASTDVGQVNNSWALASVDQDINLPYPLLGNLTACGLAPTLNYTLNATADTSPQLYQTFSQGTIFGWAPGEPKDASTATNKQSSEEQFRCVVMDASKAYRGHWRVANCQEKYRAACRIGDQPFDWRLSSSEIRYGDAPAACRSDSKLGMPRTGLENRYLYEHLLRDMEEQPGKPSRDSIWINLNSLDVEDCWVTSGPNGSCSYQNDQETRHDREVLIPTIAALIVLILTVLTILVKCNVNRRNSRVRRMGPGGWEYEGVPS